MVKKGEKLYVFYFTKFANVQSGKIWNFYLS